MNRIKVFLNYPSKKSLFKIIKELFILTLKKREIPFYYFKYLYRKNAVDYLDHLSLNEQKLLQYHRSLHNPDYLRVINNKLFFSVLNKRNLIETPLYVGHNFGVNFFYDNKMKKVTSYQDLIDVFKNIFDKTGFDSLFFRPPSDQGGKGCFKININNLEEGVKKDYETLINGNFVFTETQKQHELINEIHGQSINTLRFITLITSQGIVEVVNSSMRFGVGNSVVDNASHGGFFVGVDLDTGTLKSKGHRLPQFGGQEIDKHPDSGFKFEGFQIPYFKEACAMVKKGVELIPDRFIGWDVAITPNGPVIIEANDCPHLQACNITDEGLLKNRHIRDVLAEIKHLD